MIRIVCCIAVLATLTPVASAHCRRAARPHPQIAYSPVVCGYMPAIWGQTGRSPSVAVTEESDSIAPRPAADRTKSPETKQPAPKTKSPADTATPPITPAKKPDRPKKEPELAAKVDQFLVPSEGKKSEPSAEVKVGFFNHVGRTLVLEIHGESVSLPSSQYVTLRLPRTFNWSEKGGKPRTVTVPSDADGIEIVFRE